MTSIYSGISDGEEARNCDVQAVLGLEYLDYSEVPERADTTIQAIDMLPFFWETWTSNVRFHTAETLPSDYLGTSDKDDLQSGQDFNSGALSLKVQMKSSRVQLS